MTETKRCDHECGEKVAGKKPGFVGRMRNISGLGILFALLYAFFMSTGVSMAKYAKPLNPIEILVIRSIMQAVVFGLLATFKGAPLFGNENERWQVLGRAVSGAVNQGGWYLSASKISLMDASAIYYTAPVFVAFLAFVFLKEPFGVFEAISVLITVTGVLLISRPQFIPWFADKDHPMTQKTIEGLILAVVSAFAFALTNIHLRKLQKTATEVVAFWFSVLTVILGVGFVLLLDKMRTPESLLQWIFVLLVGVCGILGQICFSLALKIEKAGPVSIAQTANIVIVLFYQIVLFHDEPSMLELIGAALIGSSVILTGLKDMVTKSNIGESIKQMASPSVTWKLDHSSELQLKNHKNVNNSQ